MKKDIAPSEAELQRAAEVVTALSQGEKLAALVYDVASRQAEGATLWSGKKFVARRAKTHGVERQQAETALGNGLDVLERGPDSGMQWALLSALFVRGFADAVRARAEERKALCAKLAEHCDFLELGSPYRVFALLPRLTPSEIADGVQTALGDLVLRDDWASGDAQSRARNAGRIAVLASAKGAAARAALERIECEAHDPYSQALAAVALGRPSRMPEPICSVSGRPGIFPRGVTASLISWLTGFALLRWLFRAALAALGVRRELELELSGETMRVRRRMRLLGRELRSAEQIHPVTRVRYARRAVRYPALPFVAGAFCFGLGLVLAGVFAFDALRVGGGALWGLAGVFLLLGAGLDLGFEVLLPGRRGQVALDLDLERKQRMRITGVPLEQADALLTALARRLARGREADRGVA